MRRHASGTRPSSAVPISGIARLMADAAAGNRPSAKSDCASRRSRPRDAWSARASADASANIRSRRSSSTRANVAVAVDGSRISCLSSRAGAGTRVRDQRA